MLNRVDFQPQLFVDLINVKGYNLMWQKNIPCPCIDIKTRQWMPDCQLCNGTGRYYYATQQIKGLIQRQQKDSNPEHYLGTLQMGEAYLTVEHSNFMGLWDRVTNLDSTVIFNDMVQHNVNVNSQDMFTYPPIGNVVYAVTSAGKRTAAINLVQGTDYSFDDSGVITWMNNGLNLVDGQMVSFRYYCRPVWVVTNVPNYVRDTLVLEGNATDTFVNMPVRFTVKLEYLSSGTGSLGGQI